MNVEFQLLPNINPADAATRPENKEIEAKSTNSLKRLANKVSKSSKIKVEKVLRLPKKPTPTNKKNGDLVSSYPPPRLPEKETINPRKKAEKIFKSNVAQYLVGRIELK